MSVCQCERVDLALTPPPVPPPTPLSLLSAPATASLSPPLSTYSLSFLHPFSSLFYIPLTLLFSISFPLSSPSPSLYSPSSSLSPSSPSPPPSTHSLSLLHPHPLLPPLPFLRPSLLWLPRGGRRRGVRGGEGRGGLRLVSALFLSSLLSLFFFRGSFVGFWFVIVVVVGLFLFPYNFSLSLSLLYSLFFLYLPKFIFFIYVVIILNLILLFFSSLLFVSLKKIKKRK